MALDRQSIEKRDFPFGRRGYEPAAVDAHLAALAREIEDLKRSQAAAPPPPPSSSSADAAGPVPARRQSLGSVASAQVQAIVEAAESSAAAIERDARERGEQTAQDAAREAQRIRDEAIERSQEHVGKIHEATTLMLQRVDAMESELAALVESLRTGANRLNADLSLLSGNMGELYAAAGRPLHDTGVAAPIVEDVVALVEEAEAIGDADLVGEGGLNTDAASGPTDDGDDEANEADQWGDARMEALNMALDGRSREEIDTFIAENYDLSDRGALIAEIWTAAER